ncbi:MAG TPA: HAD family hydrolase [Candidatus Limnocylindrales bacterium]|nr:HAD family hydrolase [Candidatus Limnocylindrales bacterium]
MSQSLRPKVVFLDVGDTLVRAHPSWAAVYRQGLFDCGIEVTEAELEQVLLAETSKGGWWLSEEPFDPTEEESFARIKEFDSMVLGRLGYPDLSDEVFRAIEAAFARRAAWYVYPDVEPAVTAMRQAGLRLAVISNWVWGGPELIHDLELARHFETLVVSARVGFQKPHEGIFRLALQRMAVSPEDAMHVGDSYAADVLGARRVGIHPVLIDRSGKEPEQTRHERGEPDLAIVRDLYELLENLGLERPAARAAS